MAIKRTIIITVGILVLAVVLTGAYYQLVYKSPVVDHGFAVLLRPLEAHTNIVNAVRFATGPLIISSGVDSTIRISTLTGKGIGLIKQDVSISSMDVSDDGKLAVTGNYDGSVRLYDLSTFKLLWKHQTDTGTVWSVDISADGQFIASGGEDKLISLHRSSSGEVVRSWMGHELIVWAIKFSPDGTHIATASFDHSWKVWDLEGKLQIGNGQHSQAIVDLAYSHDGRLIATASDDETIRLWEAGSAKLLRIIEVPEHVQAIAFSPDDKIILTGGADKPMTGELFQNFFGDSHVNKGVSGRLFNVHTGELLQTLSVHANDITDVAFSAEGKYFATCSSDYTVDIWELKSVE